MGTAGGLETEGVEAPVPTAGTPVSFQFWGLSQPSRRQGQGRSSGTGGLWAPRVASRLGWRGQRVADWEAGA